MTGQDDRLELFDLRADPDESADLAARMLKKVAELRRRLSEWRTSVDGPSPPREAGG